MSPDRRATESPERVAVRVNISAKVRELVHAGPRTGISDARSRVLRKSRSPIAVSGSAATARATDCTRAAIVSAVAMSKSASANLSDPVISVFSESPASRVNSRSNFATDGSSACASRCASWTVTCGETTFW